MMLKICKECGQEVKGCSSCNPTCPLCGGEVKKVDLVAYRLKQEEEEEENGEDS